MCPAGTTAYNDAMKSRYLLAAVIAAHSATSLAGADTPAPCSDAWNRYVDGKITSGDGQGHGPDLGSDEWKGVVEFRLGVRGLPEVPARDSDGWCHYIDRLVEQR